MPVIGKQATLQPPLYALLPLVLQAVDFSLKYSFLKLPSISLLCMKCITMGLQLALYRIQHIEEGIGRLIWLIFNHCLLLVHDLE
jgi:hypothetical protein